MSNGMDLCQIELPSTMVFKQGVVLSAILFCAYIDDLFKILRKKKSGCWMNKDFFGIIGYADDIFLLQDMIATCETYASTYNLSFSTDEP